MSWQHLSSDWLNWADQLAPAAQKINRHLVAALDLPVLARAAYGRGLTVLDLASGVGEPAFGIARMLAGDDCDADKAPSGQVIASDIVPGMCAGLAERAGAEGIGNLSVVAADMEKLPFGTGTMDAISCRFGVMFCHDPDAALHDASRVLRTGGRAVFMLWAPLIDNPLFAAMDAVLGNILGTGFANAGLDLFGFADPGSATARMVRAGFGDVTITTHNPAGRIPERAAFWKPQMEMLFGPQLRAATDAERGAIDAAMFKVLRPYVTDGYFQVPICFHVLAGVKG
ncbi:class I SAM-dependent methyltransferase [Thalassospira xiamenensis]|uniref:Methyltransferase domain-containing protein n=1 Tax=Thalassospira xiamenensis TaxID=220697 RepID=A0A285RMA9_9PROT|nr:methyltransferase domain-containing protein [Thalassospira xiamenensis]SOB95255.1 Methyltransferase domain-containing protein [Thalassospira xiamenensis]